MAAYRFRVYIEDNEDVYRDIDVRSGQTFEELHNTYRKHLSSIRNMRPLFL
jgi:hypothetical protein